MVRVQAKLRKRYDIYKNKAYLHAGRLYYEVEPSCRLFSSFNGSFYNFSNYSSAVSSRVNSFFYNGSFYNFGSSNAVYRVSGLGGFAVTAGEEAYAESYSEHEN